MRPTTALPTAIAVALLFTLTSLTAAVPAWATTWTVALRPVNTGQAKAQAAPTAPASVTATCTSAGANTIKLTWPAVAHSANYTVYQSTTTATGPYSSVATVTVTNWTSPALAAGKYWYQIRATIGASWLSPNSPASAQRTITAGPSCS